MRYLSLLFLPFFAIQAGCIKNAKTARDIPTDYDQKKVVRISKPFQSAYDSVVSGANSCWSNHDGKYPMQRIDPVLAPRRDVESSIITADEKGTLAVFVHGSIYPTSYFLRADIEALDAQTTQVTSYNLNRSNGQRIFHEQIKEWLNGRLTECLGMGMWGSKKSAFPDDMTTPK